MQLLGALQRPQAVLDPADPSRRRILTPVA
jgi:hypothetical protein